jgi:RNA ligase (TIGR02306 family)
MASSTHKAEVVPVVLEPHPNADRLSIVKIYGGGYQVVVRTEDWIGKDRGVYIPPDNVVPDTPEFAFLKGERRIKARRLRGQWSAGLLVPAPPGAQIGEDMTQVLGIVHYEPPEPNPRLGGKCEQAPPGHYPVYDVESFRKYGRSVFEPGEMVVVTEKIHGTNGRWVYVDGRFRAGSRTTWKSEADDVVWWKALRQYPALQDFLRANPGTAVYGEVYGWVQDLRYGAKPGQVHIAVFDIWHNGQWVDAKDLYSFGGPDLPWVPIVDCCPMDYDRMLALAEGNTLIPGANHCREGIVIKPMQERWHPECERVILKVVSNTYLERA